MNSEQTTEAVKKLCGALWDTLGSKNRDILVNTFCTDTSQLIPKLKVLTSHGALLHRCATNGTLDKVPAELISQESLTAREFNQGTVLHFATRAGLSQIPAQYITPANMMLKNREGETVLKLACKPGGIGATKQNDWEIIKPMLTENNIRDKARDMSTILHTLAETGALDKLPKGAITTAGLSDKDRLGDTPLHIAARFGYLSQIHEYLTEDLLLIKSQYDRTVAATAARHGYAYQIPSTLLTQKVLLSPLFITTLINKDNLDHVLGANIPEIFRQDIAEEWWEKNQEIKQIKGRKNLDPTQETDIDLF